MQPKDMDHHCKILKAQCIVDARPPQFKVETFLRSSKMQEDNRCFKRIIAENMKLLERINKIQRIGGSVQSYNKSTATRKTRIQEVERWLNKIEVENLALGRKLLCMKPTMCTRTPYKPRGARQTSQEQAQNRRELYENYKDVMPVENPYLIPKLLWPRIFIEVEVDKVGHFGRLVIVLCTEAAPSVVLQLVRMCKEGKSVLKFNRVYPNLWIEGEIAGETSHDPPQKVNPHIDHGQSGTLALLERGTGGSLQFSVSFKPLTVLNGKRVAFGKVVQGLNILSALQDYGSKNGKPKKRIVATTCGLVK